MFVWVLQRMFWIIVALYAEFQNKSNNYFDTSNWGCLYKVLYHRHFELISKLNVGLKTLLHEGLSEPEFYGAFQFKKSLHVTDV